jgi:hypothetical protein
MASNEQEELQDSQDMLFQIGADISLELFHVSKSLSTMTQHMANLRNLNRQMITMRDDIALCEAAIEKIGNGWTSEFNLISLSVDRLMELEAKVKTASFSSSPI